MDEIEPSPLAGDELELDVNMTLDLHKKHKKEGHKAKHHKKAGTGALMNVRFRMLPSASALQVTCCLIHVGRCYLSWSMT